MPPAFSWWSLTFLIEEMSKIKPVYRMFTVFQAYHNQEIGFHKLCRLVELKNPSHALELEGLI